MTDASPPDGPVTRGFEGRRRPARRDRIPPGQYDVGDRWPVLSAELPPNQRTDDLTLTVDGAVERPTTWTWDELHALPASRYVGDVHCVTTWSKLDMTFAGVSLDTLLDLARPTAEARYAVGHSVTGYTTNLPLADVSDGRAWVVWQAQGKPLTVEHGGPLRLLVPHLYLWKSAKWIERVELVPDDRPGFWERNGYHDRGDPWLEQRYQGDP